MLANFTTSGVNWILFALAWFTFGLKVFAMVDAALRPPQAFVAAGRLTKLIWCAILGVTLLVALVIGSPLSFLNIIGDVAALVYVLDVRPAMRALGPGGAIFKRKPKRGGIDNSGW